MNIRTLLEIIDTRVTNKKYSGKFKTSPDSDDNMDVGVLGRGFYSTVVPDREDPHLVRKHSHRFNSPSDKFYDNDTYDQFSEYVYTNKLYDNPYFPRIYKHDKISDKSGQMLHKYQIERLEHLTALDVESIRAMYIRLFPNGDDLYYDIIESNKNHGPQPPPVMFKLKLNIAKTIQNCIKTGNTSNIIDDALIEAINYLNHFIHNVCEKCVLDLHVNNYMVRRTPHGFQLVISDPVAYDFSGEA